MHSFKIIAAMAILARGVLSEGIHMINCTPWGAAGSERIWRSYVVVRAMFRSLGGYIRELMIVCV